MWWPSDSMDSEKSTKYANINGSQLAKMKKSIPDMSLS